MRSLPRSPERMSTRPGPPASVSLPSPPQTMSLPSPPSIVSSPWSPTMTSAPGVPVSTSLPAVPVIVGRSCKHVTVCWPAAPATVASSPAARRAATRVDEPRAIAFPIPPVTGLQTCPRDQAAVGAVAPGIHRQRRRAGGLLLLRRARGARRRGAGRGAGRECLRPAEQVPVLVGPPARRPPAAHGRVQRARRRRGGRDSPPRLARDGRAGSDVRAGGLQRRLEPRPCGGRRRPRPCPPPRCAALGGDTNFMPVLADVKVLPEHLAETRRRL